jgi:hypothetical protein
VLFANRPRDLLEAAVVFVSASPVVDGSVAIFNTLAVEEMLASPTALLFGAAAFAGATDRTPAPNAATATSAMRL